MSSLGVLHRDERGARADVVGLVLSNAEFGRAMLARCLGASCMYARRLAAVCAWGAVRVLCAAALVGVVVGTGGTARADQAKADESKVDEKALCASIGPDGKLVYTSDGNGNRVPDFSHCGYRGGGIDIPHAKVRVVVPPVDGDAGPVIQAAIDRVAAIDWVAELLSDNVGLRGAVLLEKGVYRISGQLRIRQSGVVLRGSGDGPDGTVLVATGRRRRSLILIEGQNDRQILEDSRKIVDDSVPVGATSFCVDKTEGLEPLSPILIERPSTDEWIREIGMDRLASGGAGGGSCDWIGEHVIAGSIFWDRVVTAVEGDRITIDAPITTTVESDWGGGRVHCYEFPGRIWNVGVENLRCRSEYDEANPSDENHAWNAVELRWVSDAWIRQLTAEHFAGSAVQVGQGTQRVTVMDCLSEKPVSELATGRRRTFFTLGQQTLFLRCKASGGRRDFAAGRGLIGGEIDRDAIESGKISMPTEPWAAGPNAFVDCTASRARANSGPLGYWAAGVLYDNVYIEEAGIGVVNRGTIGCGFGWAGANCLLWNCEARSIRCNAPPTAQNWAVGCVGRVFGNGQIAASGEQAFPRNLYQTQLEERLGEAAFRAVARVEIPTDVDEAELLPPEPPQPEDLAPAPPDEERRLTLSNGWFDHDGRVVWGYVKGSGYTQTSLAQASLVRNGLEDICQGRTEELDSLTANMIRCAYPGWYHCYGLWYDRRRDRHDTGRRWDAHVAPPFLEQPWARSGQGLAWDGLSKYDLAQFNSLYFERLRRFAELCDRRGTILFHNFYLQPCLSGENLANYVDFPWRPVNCIQPVEMPSQMPAADAFYDVSIPLHAELHRKYIYKCLDELGDHANVVHLTGAGYSGPASFVKFWMDTIRQWERMTGKKVKIGLGGSREVMSELLAEESLAAGIDVIELGPWGSADDERPKRAFGGRYRAQAWPGGVTPGDVYRQVKQARLKYPRKGLIKLMAPAPGDTRLGTGPEVWAQLAVASLMGGGCLPVFSEDIVVNRTRHYDPPENTPAIQPLYDLLNLHLATRLQNTRPAETLVNNPRHNWCLADPGTLYLVYSRRGGRIELDLSADSGSYRAMWFDFQTGQLSEPVEAPVQAGGLRAFDAPDRKPGLLWLDSTARPEQPKPADRPPQLSPAPALLPGAP